MHQDDSGDASPAEDGMKPITLRNVPADVARAIEDKARRERLSLNKAVVRLLEEAVAPARGALAAHHDLDRFFGAWTKKDARTFDRTLRRQRAIDPEMWD
jgi:hypothetical protein